jgi:RNA polymerase-binding transcription factor DksA
MTNHDPLRERLLTRLGALTNRADRIEADLRQLGDRDSAERASEQENDEVLEGLDEVTLAEVGQIRLALDRLDQGTYGTCTRCGHPIGTARLVALPAATECAKCAAQVH